MNPVVWMQFTQAESSTPCLILLSDITSFESQPCERQINQPPTTFTIVTVRCNKQYYVEEELEQIKKALSSVTLSIGNQIYIVSEA